MASKAEDAFRTIGEVSAELGLPQHILRYWETRFPQLRPVTRAGNRRYYRPADVALVRRIDQALNRDGYTIKGVQKMLADKAPPPASLGRTQTPPRVAVEDVVRLLEPIRDELIAALRN
jgi:DNA-binding transcriptional MerR regulator